MQQEWTGERLETFVFNEATIEHLHRYAIALDIIQDKVVLDIACGEGYGSNLLSTKAKTIFGVDKDEATIIKASKKYIKSNLSFVNGLAEQIPFPDNMFDVVVSFETLEHVTEQEKMFIEIKRVLHPDGIVIISTPEKKYYSEITSNKNPFHLQELYEKEFFYLVNSFFKNSYFMYQKLLLSSIVLTNQESEMKIYGGEFKGIWKKNFDPVYLIAVASDGDLAKPSSSIFEGQSILQTSLDEKEKALKSLLTYKLGHFILYPFKLLKNIFKHKNNSMV